MIRFAVVVAWATLLVVLVGLAVGGCGSVDLVTAGADAPSEADAADTVAASHAATPDADASEAASTPAATDAGREAATCAPSTMPPYCASCRDSRGVCMCGALPCCDQHCQS